MPEQLIEVLSTFNGSNLLRMALPLILFSGLLVAAKGPRALRLSDETLRSATVTLGLLIINGYLASYLVLQIDLTMSSYEAVGLPHLSTHFWEQLPWPVTVLVVMILLDFVDYWTHRLMHNSPLWGVHAVHHTEQRMTWLTSSRVHIFETSIMKIGYVVLLGWTGIPIWALLAASAVAYLHNRYVHCDVGWNHGPLAKVVASPNWHRWHHSIDPTAYNRNYANVFSFIDVIFGTYYNPGRCNTEVGLTELPRPGIVNQMLYPFTYLLDQTRSHRSQQLQPIKVPANSGQVRQKL